MGVFHERLQPQFSQWEWFMKVRASPLAMGVVHEKLQPPYSQWECFIEYSLMTVVYSTGGHTHARA